MDQRTTLSLYEFEGMMGNGCTEDVNMFRINAVVGVDRHPYLRNRTQGKNRRMKYTTHVILKSR